ncbi:MAG TPA: GAF domain-containing protein, partial [Vicinamibacteria bacterium]|nr:GAF domain-containing protein [Vicinamibacteria bacterium]
MLPLDVLYLESRPGSGRSPTRRLKERGIDVRTAPLASVSAEIQSRVPNVVICELDTVSDRATLERVASAVSRIPLLVVAGHEAVALARDAAKLGVCRFLTRPVRTTELELALHQALQQPARRDLERLEFANRQLAALNDVSNRFSRIRDERELLDEVPRLLTESLEFDRGILLLHQDGSFSVRSICFPRDPPEFAESFLSRIRSGELPLPPPFAESFDKNEPIFIADPNTHPHWPKAPGEVIRTRSIVIAPIRSQNRPIGILMGNMQHHERAMD